MFQSTSSEEDVVSVAKVGVSHALRGFNPRPPKRTLCHSTKSFKAFHTSLFQSTSSEEDVVSANFTIPIGSRQSFQSTSSEEDVVSL